MLIQLTHPQPNYDFWLESDEIAAMERYTKVKSIIIQGNDDQPDLTAIVLKNGRNLATKDTPAQIIEKINKANSPVTLEG